jgi:methyl-accepting chemotaxis protein
MSRGNLREKFEVACSGDHEKLKEAVNGLHSWLCEWAAAASKIAVGDLAAAIPKGSEEDRLHGTLAGLRSNISALSADASMLAKAVSEGNYAARADTAKHHGEFRNIISRANEILDIVVGHVKTAAEYRERISKGEISEKMPEINKDTATNLFLEMMAKNRPYL